MNPNHSIGSGSLPVALTSFIGREFEKQEVKALIAANRLVTLTGTLWVWKDPPRLAGLR